MKTNILSDKQTTIINNQTIETQNNQNKYGLSNEDILISNFVKEYRKKCKTKKN